jgi:hypothetical protein
MRGTTIVNPGDDDDDDDDDDDNLVGGAEIEDRDEAIDVVEEMVLQEMRTSTKKLLSQSNPERLQLDFCSYERARRGRRNHRRIATTNTSTCIRQHSISITSV